MGFLLLVNMAGKTSWLEQVLEALSADDKNLLSEYRYRLFKSLESSQRTSDAELSDQKYIFHLQLQLLWLC